MNVPIVAIVGDEKIDTAITGAAQVGGYVKPSLVRLRSPKNVSRSHAPWLTPERPIGASTSTVRILDCAPRAKSAIDGIDTDAVRCS